MDCEIKYKGKDYTYDQFATLLHEGELEILAPKMDSRYFVISEEYNPFEDKGQVENVEIKPDTEVYEGIFNPKKTGISGLDDLLEDDGYNYFYKGVSGDVVMMSPDEYLKRVREGLGTKDDANVTQEKKDAINKAINEGNKINMPFLSTRSGRFGQEGRNRAIIAKERGEKLIPVFIEKDVSYDDKIAKGKEYIESASKQGATTKEQVLSKLKENGLHRDGIRFIDDNFDDNEVAKLIKEQPLEKAKKNLKKAWNKLGSQGIVYDPIQNERDFIDFVKALFDFVKVYGRDKAIPEIVKYAKTKLGIGDKGSMKPELANSIEQYAQSLLDKYSELTPSEIDAVLGAFANNVSKESFNKNVDTMVRFAKMKESKANQFKELYDEASQIKTAREEEKVKTMGDKPKFASPLQILLLDVGDNPNGELLQRITAITTDRNQERSNEDLQKDATYVEESLERLRNVAFDDASMLFNFYNSSPDWVSKFLTELEDNVKKGKSGEGYMIPPARLVGILNVMNNDTYERILKATDPIEREELLKLRDRLDSFTNDTMRGYSLAFNARRSDLILAEFARGGVLNDYATSRILTKKQTEQVSRIQDAIKNKASQKQLNNVNIPSANPITPTTSKSKPKASNKKKVDAKFEAEMIEESKKAKSTSREERAKDLRDRLFNAINKCK
jgi:hypothetical protein